MSKGTINSNSFEKLSIKKGPHLKKRLEQDGEEATLAVIQDIENGKVYYMDILGILTHKDIRYAVMVPFSSISNKNKLPEVVIMRVISPEKAEIIEYESVHSDKEADEVFEVFFSDYKDWL